MIAALMLILPLMGALFQLLLGRRTPRRVAEWVSCASVIGSFVLAFALFFFPLERREVIPLCQWFTAGDLTARFDVLLDSLSVLMAAMVTFVSALVHVYSIGYMRDDGDYVRYFCFLNLFVFSMLVITLADNMLFLFLGWEGVGFCSYALIGFWFEDSAKATAGRKAFMLTRIGDVAFGIALGVFFFVFGNFSISFIIDHASSLSTYLATMLGLLLLWSAVGKSAQLPLSVWLPDAMAGPTPVSALIHAATMVTAGVYLLIRLYPVIELSSASMSAIALVGTATALFASFAALGQTDIKRILAYSTISQLGYMFVAVGSGDIIGGMSYLLSHAFFKSLLFLAAGYIIQALHDEHDIFKMGERLRRGLPGVFRIFLAGACSLAALPPTGGFLNKDRVLLAAYNKTGEIYAAVWALTLFSCFLTSLYSFRMVFVVFSGKGETKIEDRPLAQVPTWMCRMLWPLAFLSLFVGYLNLPPVWGGREWLAHFLASVPGSVPHLDLSEFLEWAMATADGFLALIALLAAYFLYGPKGRLRTKSAPWLETPRLLIHNGFYLDRCYQFFIAWPYQQIARFLWRKVDEGTIDRGMVGYGNAIGLLSSGLRLWASGRLSVYLGTFLLGFGAVLLTLYYIG